jgi:hypothetical protein
VGRGLKYPPGVCARSGTVLPQTGRIAACDPRCFFASFFLRARESRGETGRGLLDWGGPPERVVCGWAGDDSTVSGWPLPERSEKRFNRRREVRRVVSVTGRNQMIIGGVNI